MLTNKTENSGKQMKTKEKMINSLSRFKSKRNDIFKFALKQKYAS